MAQPAPRYPLQVEGREVLISNPDKVFYPETGMTKLEVIDYYIRISPALLPHLRDRPLSLKRYPHGVGVSYFYQKEAPEHRPDWIRTTPVESTDRTINYVVCDDLPTLVWLANAADLEMHTFMHTAKDLARPTQVAFDLDPGPGADARTCARVALMLRDHFEALGLKAFPKVSGSKGVQLHVPLNTPVSYEETKAFSKALAVALQTEHPKLVTALMRKDLRKDKVFIDWSQNDEHKTTVCVYSMRGVAVPSVAAPVDWKELEAAVDARDLSALRFPPDEAVKRLKRKGDLFAAVETLKQRLPGAAEDEPEPAPNATSKAKPAAKAKARAAKARR
jgi:bifunctional non-homologous end joining protein LigD